MTTRLLPRRRCSAVVVAAGVLMACGQHSEAQPVAAPALGALPGHATRDLVVTASLAEVSGKLELTYTVEDRADDDAYVLDVSQVVAGRTTAYVVTPIYLAWTGGGNAHLVQGIAPLPPDRDMNVRVIPLAQRVPAHGKLVRTVFLPRPLAEFGPYDVPAAPGAEQPLRELVVMVMAMRPSARGFRRTAMDGTTDIYRVEAAYTLGSTEHASARAPFPSARALRTFKLVPGTVASFARLAPT